MSNNLLNLLRWPKEGLSLNNDITQSILRILAALIGGYASTYSLMAALVLLLPLPQADVVFLSMLFPCIFYLAAVLWAFGAPTAQRAWRDLLIVTVVAGGLALAASWLR
jgi:hypothetical protein